MFKPHSVNRSAIQEWVKWMILTAAVFLINGALYSFKYPANTFSAFSASLNTYLGPVQNFGPTNATGQYAFAPVVAASGPTLPLISIVALVGALLCIIIESDLFPLLIPDGLHVRHAAFKAIFYGLLGIYTINQFTVVPSATFLIVASFCLFYDSACEYFSHRWG